MADCELRVVEHAEQGPRCTEGGGGVSADDDGERVARHGDVEVDRVAHGRDVDGGVTGRAEEATVGVLDRLVDQFENFVMT
jgi:hypothetical protein